jgi:hypothetical protein
MNFSTIDALAVSGEAKGFEDDADESFTSSHSDSLTPEIPEGARLHFFRIIEGKSREQHNLFILNILFLQPYKMFHPELEFFTLFILCI